jgi:O-antigen/teichoic acid export membrane protein
MSYWEAANIIPILSFSMVFVMMKENVLIGLQITKSSRTMGLLIALTAVFNLGMNMLLIPKFLLYGAAISTVVSQAGMFLLFLWVAQKKYPVPYEVKHLMMLFFAGAILFLLSMISNEWSLIPRLTFKFLLIALFPLILFLFRFFEPIELLRMKELFRKYKRIFFKR